MQLVPGQGLLACHTIACHTNIVLVNTAVVRLQLLIVLSVGVVMCWLLIGALPAAAGVSCQPASDSFLLTSLGLVWWCVHHNVKSGC